jgi:hypothetical protein
MATFCQAFSRGGRTAGTLMICLFAFGVLAAAQGRGADVNTVKRIQTVDGVVEIEIQSNREFPIRDQVVVLRIGDKEFQRSRTPENGSLKTLIFMLTPAQFDALVDDAQMTVKYGRHGADEGPDAAVAAARGLRWNFGKLNKAMHQQ